MQFSQSFNIACPREQVWDLFQNVPEVVTCIPGAKLTEDRGDGTYLGVVESRLGPVTAVFEGEGIHTVDVDAFSGRLDGNGRDRKAGSRAKAKIAYQLEPIEGGTQVDVDSDITLSGAAAQFGRPGLVRELTARIMQEFATNVEAKIAAVSNPQEHISEHNNPEDVGEATAAPPPQMGSIVLASFWSWLCNGILRLFGKGDSK